MWHVAVTVSLVLFYSRVIDIFFVYMSYFYGTAVNNFDSHVEGRTRRRHSKQRISTKDNDLEPIHGSKPCRRHASRIGYVSRSKATPADVQDDNRNDNDASSSKCKSRHHLRREIERLIEENRTLSAKLDGSIGDSAAANESKGKDVSISKIRSRYHKLEKCFQEIQVERDKLTVSLEQREAEYSRLNDRYEELTRIVQGVERERSNLAAIDRKFETENAQLNEDVTLLKSLIYRLNVEIERYQDKLRHRDQTVDVQNITSVVVDDDNGIFECKRISESWGRVNLHALGPLLNAYQENLSEKDELVKKYGQEIDAFSGRCKEVIEENENLYKEAEDLKLKCDRYTEEMKIITKDAVLVKEQNDLLTKQVALQKQKLQEIHSVYEQKVESMSQDNNKLHKEYLACKTELSNLQGRYEILNEGYDKLKNNCERTMPVLVHTTAVEECKRLFDELKHQYESEKKKLTSKIQHLEETQPETERQLITMTAERDQLKSLSKNLEKSAKRTQHKLEHLQNAIYSIQVSRDSFKRQLNKITAYCEELVTEQEKLLTERDKLLLLLREREKESEDIQYLGNNIAHRMGNLKSQLKVVQKGAREQLATVEKHMKTQELGVDQMKAEYHRELQRLKQLVKEKEDVIGKLQREKWKTQDNLELVWRAATSDDKKVKDALRNTKMYNI